MLIHVQNWHYPRGLFIRLKNFGSELPNRRRSDFLFPLTNYGPFLVEKCFAYWISPFPSQFSSRGSVFSVVRVLSSMADVVWDEALNAHKMNVPTGRDWDRISFHFYITMWNLNQWAHIRLDFDLVLFMFQVVVPCQAVMGNVCALHNVFNLYFRLH